jgi:type I restriction enzyme S subunit
MSFPRYPEYKESGVEWLGEIPAHWEITPLKYVAYMKSGEQITSEQITDSGDFPVYGGNGLRGYFEKFTHEGEFCLIGRQGALCGNINYAKGKFWASEHAVVVTPLGLANTYYLGELLRSMNLGQYSTSAAQPGLSVDAIGNLRIPSPTYDEQALIANFLDQETTKIDDLVAEQQKLIELLKTKLDSLVLNAVKSTDTTHSRLVHVVDVMNRPVIQEDGISYEPLGLLNRGRGLFHKENRQKSEMGDSDFYWIKEGDLILSGQFAWEGAVAMAYSEEEGCVVSHRYPVLRGKKGRVLTEYLFALFTTSHGDFLLNESSIGAAGRNRPLNMNLLLKEVVPVPNYEIQKEIAETVNQRRDLLRIIEDQKMLLNERRSALISAAVKGQIDVRKYQPKEVA